jgi:hypothetical protein
MIALDDSYRLTPEARRSAMVAAIEEGFSISASIAARSLAR